MEAIVTVEFRFSYGYKYTSRYKGMEVTVVPSFGTPLKFVGFKDRSGLETTILAQVSEEEIIKQLIKLEYKPLFMKWCMEESRDYGYNPFVKDVKRLTSASQHVYITHDLDDNLIKVGTSASYKTRLSALYARKGHTFKMLGLMQGHFNTERAVCEKFKEHLAVGREWFYPHKEIFDFVENYTFHPGDSVNP